MLTIKRNPKELSRETIKLARQAQCSDYLYVEFCEVCSWPILLSVRSIGRQSLQCKRCKEDIKEQMSWNVVVKKAEAKEEITQGG